MCMPACVYIYHIHVLSRGREEGIVSSGSEVTGGSTPPDVVAEPSCSQLSPFFLNIKYVFKSLTIFSDTSFLQNGTVF